MDCFVCLFVCDYLYMLLFEGIGQIFYVVSTDRDDNKVCYRIRRVVDIVFDELSKVYEKNYLVVI